MNCAEGPHGNMTLIDLRSSYPGTGLPRQPKTKGHSKRNFVFKVGDLLLEVFYRRLKSRWIVGNSIGCMETISEGGYQHGADTQRVVVS